MKWTFIKEALPNHNKLCLFKLKNDKAWEEDGFGTGHYMNDYLVGMRNKYYNIKDEPEDWCFNDNERTYTVDDILCWCYMSDIEKTLG